ncbi:PREDICTED: mucin-5AC-like isoform X2 [Tarenaya hassleriana]|uniref:mucin-5AC-like isoform X2 n=1 Tax=Tarenaya hassleriana TaxID=28532 RepID=UPI0008FD87F6|nr:PREDICTED: mucin-5AC-like isoform X2 [Tarenaya hassleriana]
MPPRLRSSTIPYSSRFAESQPPSSAGVGTALTGRFAAPLPSTGGVLTDPSSSVNPPLLSPDISGQAPGMPQSPVSGEDSGPPPVTQVTGVSLLASGPSTALIPLSASSPSASLTQREQNLTPASFADVAPPVTTGVSLPTSGLPAVPILSPVSFPSASAASIADAALPVTHQTGGPPAAQVLASSRRTLETTAPQADQTAPPQKSWSSMVRDSIRKLKRIGTSNRSELKDKNPGKERAMMLHMIVSFVLTRSCLIIQKTTIRSRVHPIMSHPNTRSGHFAKIREVLKSHLIVSCTNTRSGQVVKNQTLESTDSHDRVLRNHTIVSLTGPFRNIPKSGQKRGS